MKIRLERDVLAEAVAWTARGLPSRPSAPARTGILLEANDPNLVLAAVDYEVSTRAQADAVVDEAGQAIVPGRLLSEITRTLPPRPVELSSEGSKVVLLCGSSRFSLPTLPADDFLAVPEMPTAAGSVDADVFAQAVSQVAVAAGRDDTLPVLTGVRIEIEESRVNLVATDRYRLAVRSFDWTPEVSGLEAVALVPARTLADTARALSRGDKVVLALAPSSAGESLIGFESRGWRTTSRLIDGEFPKYRGLLPSDHATLATVDTGQIVEAVKRVALVAERNTPVRLTFTAAQGGSLQLDAGTGDEAQASEVLDCVVDGEDIAIAFNPGYLLDGLGAVSTPLTRMSFTSATKPAVLSGLESDSPEHVASDPAASAYRYLLMPVRLSG